MDPTNDTTLSKIDVVGFWSVVAGVLISMIALNRNGPHRWVLS
jgi:hypothetical protein